MSSLAKKLFFFVTLAFINDLTHGGDVIMYGAYEGHEIELICTKEGETFDKVEWKHSGTLITDDQFKRDPKTQNIKFIVTEDTSYDYSCTKYKGDKVEKLKFHVSSMGDPECKIPAFMEANKYYLVHISLKCEGVTPNHRLKVGDEDLTTKNITTELSELEVKYNFHAKPKYDGKKMVATFDLFDLQKSCFRTLNITHAPDNLDIKVNQNEDKWSITCSSNGNPDPHMTLKSEKGVVAQGVSRLLTYPLEKDSNFKNLTFTCSSKNKLSTALVEKSKTFQIIDKKTARNTASSQWPFGGAVMGVVMLVVGRMLQ